MNVPQVFMVRMVSGRIVRPEIDAFFAGSSVVCPDDFDKRGALFTWRRQ